MTIPLYQLRVYRDGTLVTTIDTDEFGALAQPYTAQPGDTAVVAIRIDVPKALTVTRVGPLGLHESADMRIKDYGVVDADRTA